MRIDRSLPRIHPLHSREQILKVSGHIELCDAEWNDLDVAVERPLHFAFNVRRRIRIRGKEEHENATRLDGMDNGRRITCPGFDIARCDPALKSPALQSGTDAVGGHFVLCRVAYENVV